MGGTQPLSPRDEIQAVVVSADPILGRSLSALLNREGIAARSARLESHVHGWPDHVARCDVLIVDGSGALELCGALIERVRRTASLVEVVLLVSDPLVFEAVEAYRGGLFAVLQCPVSSDTLSQTVHAAGARKRRAEVRLRALDNGLLHVGDVQDESDAEMQTTPAGGRNLE